MQAGEFEQLADGRADQCFDVHRLAQCFAGQRRDARDQRPAEQHRVVHGDTGTDILAKHADVGRQAAAGNLFAGEDLNQLPLAARRILRRKHLQDVRTFAECLTDRGNGLRLVVLDTDHDLSRGDQVDEDVDAADQGAGALAHQQVIGSDVGLALGAIDDQRADLLGGSRGQLHCGRKAGPTKAGNAGLANPRE